MNKAGSKGTGRAPDKAKKQSAARPTLKAEAERFTATCLDQHDPDSRDAALAIWWAGASGLGGVMFQILSDHDITREEVQERLLAIRAELWAFQDATRARARKEKH